MSEPEYPVTPAVRLLRDGGIPFSSHFYSYEEHGGAPRAATELGVPLHQVVKTIVMSTETHQTILILMHGDMEISVKQMARILSVKRITPCDPVEVHRQTGYIVGGISPLGTRNRLPVYVEASVLELPVMYLNGGKRGFLIGITPDELRKVLVLTPVSVAVPADSGHQPHR